LCFLRWKRMKWKSTKYNPFNPFMALIKEDTLWGVHSGYLGSAWTRNIFAQLSYQHPKCLDSEAIKECPKRRFMSPTQTGRDSATRTETDATRFFSFQKQT
jgi:hypothetical protein